MPKGGVKCPDCGYRFKAKRDRDDGSLTTDAVRSMNEVFDAPDGNITTWLCPGASKKHGHPPQVVIIQRVGDKDTTALLHMKIITPQAKEMLEAFADQWYEDNKLKYRPDLVFAQPKYTKGKKNE